VSEYSPKISITVPSKYSGNPPAFHMEATLLPEYIILNLRDRGGNWDEHRVPYWAWKLISVAIDREEPLYE